jgi:O-antigen/teichoic acid export membrane protein
MTEISISRALRSGILWSSVNAILSQASGFVIFLILARALPPELFGVVALSSVIADFLANEGRYAGMDAVIQAKGYDRKTLNSAFYGLLSVALPFAALLVAAAPLVADYQNAPLIRYFMPIFGLMLLATPWLSVMDALIMKDLGFKTFTQRNIVSTFAGGAAGIMLAFTPWAIWALVVQRVVSVLAVLLFEYRYTRWRPGFDADWHIARNILRRFLPLWSVAALSLSTQRAVVLIFGLRYDERTVGLFRAADRIGETMQGPLIGPLFSLWLPLMTKVRGDIAKEQEVYVAIIRTAAFVSLPAFTGLFVVSDDIVALLLPHAYYGVAPIIRSVAIISLMIPIAWFNPIAMNALNLNRASLKYSIAVAVTCITVLLCLPKISPQAAIIWMSAPALVYGIAGNLFLHKRLKLSHLSVYRGLAPAAIGSAFMGLATWWTRSEMLDWNIGFRLGLTILIGVIAYLGWLGTFHRQWTAERVKLLLGRS